MLLRALFKCDSDEMGFCSVLAGRGSVKQLCVMYVETQERVSSTLFSLEPHPVECPCTVLKISTFVGESMLHVAC